MFFQIVLCLNMSNMNCLWSDSRSLNQTSFLPYLNFTLMFAETPTLIKIKLNPKLQYPAVTSGNHDLHKHRRIDLWCYFFVTSKVFSFPGHGWPPSHMSEPTAHGCHVKLHSTHVQRLQAVPAEGMLAVLTHHLCAALIPLDVHPALGAAFDGRVALFHLERRAVEDIL